MTVEELLAKQEITEVLYRVARGTDRANCEALFSSAHQSRDENGELRDASINAGKVVGAIERTIME